MKQTSLRCLQLRQNAGVEGELLTGKEESVIILHQSDLTSLASGQIQD